MDPFSAMRMLRTTMSSTLALARTIQGATTVEFKRDRCVILQDHIDNVTIPLEMLMAIDTSSKEGLEGLEASDTN